MGVIASVTSTLSFGLVSGECTTSHSERSLLYRKSGGHVGMVWGWLIPCLFVMPIAASLAELASSMPYVHVCFDSLIGAYRHMDSTSAGLYYFAAKMAPERHAPLASWVTGWANITGQVTLVCSIDFTW